MTKINNKRLFHFEQPEGCWHDWEKTTAKDSLILIYKCKICGTLQGPLSDQSDFIPNPSYSTSPADRERLWGYLMGKEEMWRYFQDWTCDCWYEDVDLINRSNSWNTEADRLAWLTIPLDGVPRWVGLLSEWLGMESVREKFGMIKCPNCVAGVEESNVTIIKECTVCSGSGKVRAEWAKEGK